ncbi:MAG: GntR family transcriptional regulator [Firmicutes bacterium]|nr:GntR family transcriptional regulator [Bacillota bacterium]
MHKPLGQITLDNYKPLRELVFEALREAIMSGQLKPGERLMEVQLAEELGVSRTPVREAIRKLELEGLVLMIPRRGAYVSEISMKDIADVFEIRAALEGLAAELAAQRCTPEEVEELERSLVKISACAEKGDIQSCIELDTIFHEQLMAASHNERLVQMVSSLREQVQRFRQTSLAHPGRMKIALEEHKKIVEAIAQGNAELAKQLAHEHIENAENSLMEAFSEQQHKQEQS